MLSEDELIKRIIEYKQYKEITNAFRDLYENNNKRLYGTPQKIELPKQDLVVEYNYNDIVETYKLMLQNNSVRLNKNAKNIEKIAIVETYSVGDTVKTMFRELIKKSKFVFNNLFPKKTCKPQEVVTAFSGLLEMSRRSKVETNQEEIFGDIIVTKRAKDKEKATK